MARPAAPTIATTPTAYRQWATDVADSLAEDLAAIEAEEAARIAADLLLVPLTQKGAASGVATLDSGGKIPAAQIPAVALSEFLGTVASEAAMLALTGQRGDWCVRSDLTPNKLFILESDDPATLADWTGIDLIGAVASVNGATGTVVLDAGDIGATPSGGLVGTDVQAQLTELDTEKLTQAQGDARYAGIIASDYTDETVHTSTAETTMISAAIPTSIAAGDLLHLHAHGSILNNRGGNTSYTPRWKIGATQIMAKAATVQATNASSARWVFDLYIAVGNPVNDLNVDLLAKQSGVTTNGVAVAAANGPMECEGTFESAAIDLTAGLNLLFTIQMDVSDANAQFTVKAWSLELVRSR